MPSGVYSAESSRRSRRPELTLRHSGAGRPERNRHSPALTSEENEIGAVCGVSRSLPCRREHVNWPDIWSRCK